MSSAFPRSPGPPAPATASSVVHPLPRPVKDAVSSNRWRASDGSRPSEGELVGRRGKTDLASVLRIGVSKARSPRDAQRPSIDAQRSSGIA